MNKVFGLKSDFSLIREEGTRIIISYGKIDVDDTNSEWMEVYLYHRQNPSIINIDTVKDAILGDINTRTDAKILSGFVWNGKPVWLSAENQRNFSEAQRMAVAMPSILPITFKLGEDAGSVPVYHEFQTAEELSQFYGAAFAYINQCLQEGWIEKDAIDWTPYEALFPIAESVSEETSSNDGSAE